MVQAELTNHLISIKAQSPIPHFHTNWWKNVADLIQLHTHKQDLKYLKESQAINNEHPISFPSKEKLQFLVHGGHARSS